MDSMRDTIAIGNDDRRSYEESMELALIERVEHTKSSFNDLPLL